MAVTQLRNAQAKSRDARRVADLRQARTALELFYDSYNYFPVYRNQSACGGWGARSTYLIFNK